MTEKQAAGAVYSVFLVNGQFYDDSAQYIRLDNVEREEINTLLSLAERQKAMDIVLRHHSQEADE